jgi:hypothetical protein
MASGGYRKPGSPAAVSGPGALSQRTDGRPTATSLEQLSSGKYGETQDLSQVAGGAAVSGPSMGNQALASALQGGGLGFGQGTAQPQTPVTDGAQYGAGAGADALNANNPTRATAQQLAQKGILAVMVKVADSDDASAEYKQYVRTLLAALPQ